MNGTPRLCRLLLPVVARARGDILAAASPLSAGWMIERCYNDHRPLRLISRGPAICAAANSTTALCHHPAFLLQAHGNLATGPVTGEVQRTGGKNRAGGQRGIAQCRPFSARPPVAYECPALAPAAGESTVSWATATCSTPSCPGFSQREVAWRSHPGTDGLFSASSAAT